MHSKNIIGHGKIGYVYAIVQMHICKIHHDMFSELLGFTHNCVTPCLATTVIHTVLAVLYNELDIHSFSLNYSVSDVHRAYRILMPGFCIVQLQIDRCFFRNNFHVQYVD